MQIATLPMTSKLYLNTEDLPNNVIPEAKVKKLALQTKHNLAVCKPVR